MGIVPGAVFLVCLIVCLVGYYNSAVSSPTTASSTEEFITLNHTALFKLLEINAALLSICFMLFLGFSDDVLDWPWRYKLILPTIASLPLLCCYNGSTVIVVPIQLRTFLWNHSQTTLFGKLLGYFVTIVSYGSTLRIVEDAAERLNRMGISCEIIEVQTLLPFDIHHQIIESLKKTSRLLLVDEDVPGGATGYMLSKIMEEQQAFRYLDVAPRSLTAKEHRTGYGSDGDYFGKPNAEQVVDVVLQMMRE